MKKILLTAFIALGFGFIATAQKPASKAQSKKQTTATSQQKAKRLAQKIAIAKAYDQGQKTPVINQKAAAADRKVDAKKDN